jgi:hypothetical protein
METFTASNGMEFRPIGNGVVNWGSGENYARVSQGLREFFQHERDTELGRWRWTEDQNYVVYKTEDYPDAVKVFNERTPFSLQFERGRYSNIFPRESAAARAYFDAHPVPKPWHDAKPGEVWVLTVDGEEFAWGAGTGGWSGRFIMAADGSEIPLDNESVTAGRRIWPEVVSDGA